MGSGDRVNTMLNYGYSLISVPTLVLLTILIVHKKAESELFYAQNILKKLKIK